MKKSILLLGVFVLFFAFGSLRAEELVLKGIYQGIDLFVVNPMLDNNGDLYCVDEIFVNDIKYPEEFNSSAFSLRLDEMSLQIGANIEIKFVHSEGCAPKVINPEVLKSLSTYSIIDMSLNDNTLNFKTKDETSKIIFVVEHYRWDRWIKVAETQGLGGPDNRSYAVEVFPMSGTNKYRVYQKDHLYRVNMSDIYEFEAQHESVKIVSKIKKVKKEIKLSAPSSFIVYNLYGDCLLEGYDEIIDVSELPKGSYVLGYENTYQNFTKK
ncbi:MAG: hypothetical protein GX879_08280 [Bacteroidales bacterium]|nr:hypothetical protein [Bacteroidales bacterium]